jgi:hypothetical protein
LLGPDARDVAHARHFGAGAIVFVSQDGETTRMKSYRRTRLRVRRHNNRRENNISQFVDTVTIRQKIVIVQGDMRRESDETPAFLRVAEMLLF